MHVEYILVEVSLSSFDFVSHLPSWDCRRTCPSVPGRPFVPGPYLMSISFSGLLLPFFLISSIALMAHSLSAMVRVLDLRWVAFDIVRDLLFGWEIFCGFSVVSSSLSASAGSSAAAFRMISGILSFSVKSKRRFTPSGDV